MAAPVALAADALDGLDGLSHLERRLQQAGLRPVGFCNKLSGETAQWLHEAALLEGLTDGEADTLGALMPRVEVGAGQPLIREGDTGDWMLLVLSGSVDVTKTTESGTQTRLAVIQAGAAVGEMSMLDASPRNASCTAITDVECAVLTRAAIGSLIQNHPAIGAKILVKLTQLLAQRLRNTSNQVVKLIQAAAKS